MPCGPRTAAPLADAGHRGRGVRGRQPEQLDGPPLQPPALCCHVEGLMPAFAAGACALRPAVLLGPPGN